MTIFVCKSCGRALKAETKPNFCYADRTNYIENISDEDAVKMGLFSDFKDEFGYFDREFGKIVFEFPGDIHYDPYSGTSMSLQKLGEFQDKIMKTVRGGK